MPGMGGQDQAREGGPPARAQARSAISALWVCRAMSWRARWGRTAPAASVPATVTVCLSRASQICWAQAAWRRAPCLFSLASMRALPASLFSAVGAGVGRYGLQDGVVLQEGSQDGLEGGAGSGCTNPESGWRLG